MNTGLIIEKYEQMKTDVKKVISELINTSWSGSAEKLGKALQLLRGLVFSDDPRAKKFLRKLDDFTSSLKEEEFTEEET